MGIGARVMRLGWEPRLKRRTGSQVCVSNLPLFIAHIQAAILSTAPGMCGMENALDRRRIKPELNRVSGDFRCGEERHQRRE